MNRWFCSLAALFLVVVPAWAHFIWIIPHGSDGTKLRVVFSEGLEADAAVPIEKIAAIKLLLRDDADRVTELGWTKDEHAYLVRLPVKGPAVVGGICKYGVLQKGEEKPYLLAYYPKYLGGEQQSGKAWAKLPLEIVPQGEGQFQVLKGGKPAADAEIVVITPAGSEEKLKYDAKGGFKVSLAKPGTYGIRARHIEASSGEYEGKKYDEIRHYATLVFQVATMKPAKGDPIPAFAPLPSAVSSFGAAVADGWLYVYGGHAVRTHDYSTESVLGSFYRLKLSDPKTWEELPSGPALQGLALVAHGGKIYRVGGMQPINMPGEKVDNRSVASFACFDPATRKWQELPDLPESRSSHDAVVAGDKLVVVGGWKMNGAGKQPNWHTTALVLDLNEKGMKWQPVSQPFKRRALSAAACDGKVYVCGGMSSDDEIALAVNIYDPKKDAWTIGPDLPGPERNGFSPATAEAGGRVYVSVADGRVFRLTTAGDHWEDVGKLARPRIVHRILPGRDGLLIAVGGAAKGENVGLTEAIRP